MFSSDTILKLCLASDTMMKVNEPMLVLELFLRGSDGKELERVIIEMNRVEAKAFVTKLKEIERVRDEVIDDNIGSPRVCRTAALVILNFTLNIYQILYYIFKDATFGNLVNDLETH